MTSIRRISAVVAAAAALCAGAFLVAPSAQAAASSYNIMFVGDKIPANVRSVDMLPLFTVNTISGCVSKLQTGQDRNSGKTIHRSSLGVNTIVHVKLYSDDQCQTLTGIEQRILPSNLSTKNWWVSLS